jgi:phage major head subunit gpT-like protein
MHGTYTAMVRKFAENARSTRDKNAFAVYRGAFTTTLTADGAAFISDSHTTITGLTVDNRVTGNPTLSPTSLNTAIVQLLEQVSQDGVVMGQQPAYLLVPSALFKSATEITGSALVSDNANNAINVFSSTYNIQVFHSPYLGAAQGGSDTAWFLLSRNHGVTRYIRQDVTTDLVDYIYSTNNNYIYKGMFREQYGVSDYVGAVGSAGA